MRDQFDTHPCVCSGIAHHAFFHLLHCRIEVREKQEGGKMPKTKDMKRKALREKATRLATADQVRPWRSMRRNGSTGA